MSINNFSVQMKEIFVGNLLLIVCSLLYLAWWIITFKPGKNAGAISVVLIITAFAFGLAGLIFQLRGINTIPHGETMIPGKYILIGGVIAYVILLIVTSFMLKRQITTELLLIVGWVVLELTMINVLYASRIYGVRTAVILGIVVVIAAVISLICYMLYYRLEGMSGYIDGMIPLGIVAAVMGIEEAAMIFS